MEDRGTDRNEPGRADDANAASELLAVASHEIRTPLGAVLTTAEALLQSGLDEQQTKYATTLRDAAAALLNLSNSLLGAAAAKDFAEEEEEVFRPFELISSVTALYEVQTRAKGLGLFTECRPGGERPVRGYPGPVRQVLINLVDNAVKYTRAGAVRVSVSCEGEGDKGRIDLRVSDGGAGIPLSERDRVFAAYSRLTVPGTARLSGQGLGLWIAKRTADKLKGELAIESSTEEGTTFHLRVPVAFPLYPATSQGVAVKSEPPKLRSRQAYSILVVDDNDAAQALAELVISAFGWTATLASSGFEALDLIRDAEAPFDCVLTDLAMPGMSGIDLARQIRTMNGNRRVPVLALSADPPAHFGDTDGESAFYGYVPKPYTPDLLYRSLIAAMNAQTDP